MKEKAGPRHFVFHANGKLVYVLGELDASVYVFDCDAATGQLKEYPMGKNPNWIEIVDLP